MPLPPSVNASVVYRDGGYHKTAAARVWTNGVSLLVGAWRPPARTPLDVSIVLEVPSSELRRRDLDNSVKPLLDAVVGKRRDQWIDRLIISKRPGDGWATIMLTRAAPAPTSQL